MKKFIIVLLVNLLSIFFLIVFADYYLLAKDSYNVDLFDYGIGSETERNENDLPFDKTKGEIITAGCSFTYGHGIPEEETFAYKLQKVSNRKVYNRGFSATGVQHVLWQIENADFFQRDDIKPDYLIYTFITDHMRRMYTNYFWTEDTAKYLRYKVKNGKLVADNPDKILLSDYVKDLRLTKNINNYLYSIKSDDEKFDFLKLHLLQAKSSLNKKYPDTKFVVLVYNPEPDTSGFKPFYTKRWKELEDNGFIVIDLSGKEYSYLKEKEYLAEDKLHPSGKAWDKAVPIVAKKLNL